MRCPLSRDPARVFLKKPKPAWLFIRKTWLYCETLSFTFCPARGKKTFCFISDKSNPLLYRNPAHNSCILSIHEKDIFYVMVNNDIF